MTISRLFFGILSVSFALPLYAMNKKQKAAGAIQVLGGAGAVAAGAVNVANLGLNLTPISLWAANGIGLGVYAVAAGIEKFCADKKGVEFKVEGGQLLIQFIDPADGQLASMRYSGAEVNRFLEKNGFIITWRDAFPYSQRAEEDQRIVNDELKPLLASNGSPYLYNQPYQIRNNQLRQAHAQAIENPVGVESLANHLAQKENLFAALRRLAIYSYKTPAHKDDRPLFTKAASQAMAKLMLVTGCAFTYPYEELVRTLRAEKEVAQGELHNEQAERNRIHNNYVAAQNNFAAEREIKNTLEADKNQLQNALNQIRRAQESSTAQKLQLYQEAADAEENHKQILAQSAQQTIDIIAENEQRLEDALALAAQQSCDIEEQRFELEKENGTLRQQLHALQQQLTNSQKIIRKQSNKNRKTVNKLQVLQRAQQK